MSHSKRAWVLGGLFLLLSQMSFAALDLSTRSFFINPYVGVDGGWRNLDWHESFGEDVFRKDYPELDAYLGVQFHRFFAFEFGHEEAFKRKSDRRVNNDNFGASLGQQFLGFNFADNGLVQNFYTFSEARLSGYHFNLVTFIPLSKCTQVMGLLGGVKQKLHLGTRIFAQQQDNVVEFSEILPIRWSQSKSVLRFGIGVRHFVSPRVGFRLFYLHENTSHYHLTTPVDVVLFTPINSTDNVTAKARSSHRVGLGVVFQFCPTCQEI